jgi:hypothetical protein
METSFLLQRRCQATLLLLHGKLEHWKFKLLFFLLNWSLFLLDFLNWVSFNFFNRDFFLNFLSYRLFNFCFLNNFNNLFERSLFLSYWLFLLYNFRFWFGSFFDR